jgi:uncharacterized protein YbjT (DUF2867 family)
MSVVVTGASGNAGTGVLEALADDAAVTEIVGIAPGSSREHREDGPARVLAGGREDGSGTDGSIATTARP